VVPLAKVWFDTRKYAKNVESGIPEFAPPFVVRIGPGQSL
jgi:hypothetical protein